MMAAESILSKRPVMRFTVALCFLLKLFVFEFKFQRQAVHRQTVLRRALNRFVPHYSQHQ